MALIDPFSIDGWLTPVEGQLLGSAADLALAAYPTTSTSLVEVGSYLGRSTILLAEIADRWGVRLVAIDPHEGQMSSGDGGEDTYERFDANLRLAGVRAAVQIERCRSTEVDWLGPISLLYIDGWHDYESVRADFGHFRPWLRGFAVFHDYRPDAPGVMQVVDELLADGYRAVERAESLIVIEGAKP